MLSPATQSHEAMALQELDIRATEVARSLLDQLLENSRLYKTTKDYKALLDFVIKLPNFAPFNAMLLQIQKPGLSFAASPDDWRERFNRSVKEGARPLLILWPFGPVAFVYDVMDTEGEGLPEDVRSFVAVGQVDENAIMGYAVRLNRQRIDWQFIDAGDNHAGSIRRMTSGQNHRHAYRVVANRNHEPSVLFATLAHELGHLFLGHLGPDKTLNVPGRPQLSHKQREIEAESVAYLVCARNGIKSKSETYLANMVTQSTPVDTLDLYQIMRAAGQVETTLGLTAHTKHYQRARKRNKDQVQGSLFDGDCFLNNGLISSSSIPCDDDSNC